MLLPGDVTVRTAGWRSSDGQVESHCNDNEEPKEEQLDEETHNDDLCTIVQSFK